jgi:dCMP deaminase|tara:strand:+ start:315 stop:725 length:411 start_codon:yes stop_codon:yes gene_type:complete
MERKEQFDKAYMYMAKIWSELSRCVKKKVGCLLVKDNMIISDGFNGMPSGMNNCCEYEHNETRWEVLHAEANAILKCAKNGISAKGATLYITLSPCPDCAKLILQSGIKKVIYLEEYYRTEGLDLLKENNINIKKL